MSTVPAPGRRFAEAQSHIRAGRLERAVECFSTVLADPTLDVQEQAVGYYERGLVYRKLREYGKGVADLQRAEALEPGDWRIPFELGLVYGKDLQRYPDSVAAFDRALALNPAEPEALSSRGIARQERGDSAGAEADYRRALELSPGHGDALFNLALLRHQRGDVAEAADLLLRARAVAPADPEIRRLAAAALRQLGAPHAARYVEGQEGARPRGRFLVPAWLAGLTVVTFVLLLNYFYPLSRGAQWGAGFLVLAVTVGVGLAERWRRIPREDHLRWSLQGAARAVRKLHQARRSLERSQLLAARFGPAYPLAHLLREQARAGARYALAHLHRTLRLVAWYHGPARALRALDACIALAECVQETALPAPPAGPPASVPALLAEADRALQAWETEVAAAAQALATIDPVVRRSGGDARNPLRTSEREAGQQSQVLFTARAAQQDFGRVRASVEVVRVAWAQGGAGRDLGRVLDQLNEAMGGAEVTLPASLVSGEGATDLPTPGPGKGVLQRLYAALCQAEADAARGGV